MLVNVQEWGCFSIFRRADDVTQTMSKGGGCLWNVFTPPPPPSGNPVSAPVICVKFRANQPLCPPLTKAFPYAYVCMAWSMAHNRAHIRGGVCRAYMLMNKNFANDLHDRTEFELLEASVCRIDPRLALSITTHVYTAVIHGTRLRWSRTRHVRHICAGKVHFNYLSIGVSHENRAYYTF